MRRKILSNLVLLFALLGLVGCNFNQKLNLEKTGKIRVVLNSGERAADINQLIQEENAFLKINLRGDVEDTQTVSLPI